METCHFSFLSNEQSKRTRNKCFIKVKKLPVLVFKAINKAKLKETKVLSSRNFSFLAFKDINKAK